MEVVELRQYTLAPGRRDELVALFDAELVESQESCGIAVIGQFTDLDRPDRFVWFRGFADMEQRRDALAAFYGGPAWARHGPAANATMLEFDDVLLLRPVTPFPARPAGPAEGPADGPAEGPLTITVRRREGVPAPDPGDVALLVTEHAPNTFPRLPVRTGEDVVVRVRRGPSPEGPEAPGELLRTIRVAPTPRSRLR